MTRNRGDAVRVARLRGVAQTALRPWYVLGAGHRWPYALVPMYCDSPIVLEVPDIRLARP
ncbi:MAG TPA: hypothetical protein VLN49_17865 [Gemmatimonadaceae bacterium]|nr:hypothetical protein [Gemmatimonadaceae bacterium]